MKKWIIVVLGLGLALIASAGSNQKPVPLDQAFTFSASLFGEDTVVTKWQIAPQHYLYKNRIHFKVLKPSDASVGTLMIPDGKNKEDRIFGKYEVFTHDLIISVPIVKPNPTATVLQVNYQGCSENGYCYPPVTKNLQIDFTNGNIVFLNKSDVTPTIAVAAAPADSGTEQDRVSRLLQNSHLPIIILSFIGFGLLLAFTPCVLPIVPILSGIIVGQRQTITTRKALALSLTYVLSMSATYAIAGLLVGYVGGSVQTLFQKPWILILFSLLFVLLALSLFGFYQIKLPSRFEEWISNLSRNQKSGQYISVSVMGCLATLIVSPCVTPALLGVLTYIGSSGNAMLGAVALFSMGIGMGVPLLLIAVAGAKLLPKAGAWMRTVENVLGILLLAVAIWILQRILPGQVSMLLWAILLIVSAVFMGGSASSSSLSTGWSKLWKGFGMVFLVYGVLLIIGAAQGNTNPIEPLRNPAVAKLENTDSKFVRVKTLTDVEAALAQAKAANKPVLLDFYANWCVSCKEMLLTTFMNNLVKINLEKFVLLQADVTDNSTDDKALLNRYGVIAPPTFVFFDAKGNLLQNLTVVGKMDAPEFVDRLQKVMNAS